MKQITKATNDFLSDLVSIDKVIYSHRDIVGSAPMVEARPPFTHFSYPTSIY